MLGSENLHSIRVGSLSRFATTTCCWLQREFGIELKRESGVSIGSKGRVLGMNICPVLLGPGDGMRCH